MNAPLYLARSGHVDNELISATGSIGYYWSSTADGSGKARRLGFNSNGVGPDNYNDRYYGFSLRCVLREFTYSVVGTGPNNNNTIPNGIDLTGDQNVGYAPNAFTTIMNTYPLYFSRSGYLDGTTLYSFGVIGSYWSSTVNSPALAYDLGFGSGALYPAYRDYRLSGRSLRCLSR